VISVILPCRNEEKYLPRCLSSLVSQTYPRDQYEIIVTDSASVDGTRLIAESFGARVVQEPRPGVALARQRGVEAARGEIVAVTSADVEVPPDWLARIAADLSADPDLLAVGGPVRSYDGNWLLDRYFIFPPTHWIFAFFGWPTFSCDNVAIRRDVLMRIGGFNVRLPSLEDTELAFRLNRIGKVRLDPLLVTRTSKRRASEGWIRFTARSLSSHIKFFVLKQAPNRFPEIR
jgi:glycosyltransferase involved in cell wall biosynthesis